MSTGRFIICIVYVYKVQRVVEIGPWVNMDAK